MVTTTTDTCRDIVSDALRKIGVVSIDEPMNADQAQHGMRALNRLLKSWQNKGYDLWAATSQSVVLTTAAAHTLNPARPLQILSCRFKKSGIERPMQSMTRDEYDNLPLKTAQGIPTTYYYDRQREAARLYVWPVLAVAAGETLEITFTREFEDMGLDDAPDVPTEWYEAVVYGLGARLADDYMISANNVVARAEAELQQALAFDREGSIFFGEVRY